MDLYPSIDLRGGRCVRLYQGDYQRETVYGTDPVAVATGFAAAGARWVHVVDLDAARTGVAENRPAVGAIAGAVHPSVKVQSGGGVRDHAAAEALAQCGVSRVVLGTAAVESPALVRELAASFPVAVGIDVRGRDVAVRGWTEASGHDVGEVLPRFEDAGVAAVIVTQIHVDGTMAGPDVEGLAGLLEATTLPVIASGGVGSLVDLEALASLSVGGRRLAGAIVGRALYEGRFTVGEALVACGR
jgi:phosphoribosylformimino-5-aminoimidazole carboxamide ribotide isomerase